MSYSITEYGKDSLKEWLRKPVEKDELLILNMFAENLGQYLEDDTHKHYYLTVKFGVKTYESYLEWCQEAKEQIKEWEKK